MLCGVLTPVYGQQSDSAAVVAEYQANANAFLDSLTRLEALHIALQTQKLAEAEVRKQFIRTKVALSMAEDDRAKALAGWQRSMVSEQAERKKKQNARLENWLWRTLVAASVGYFILK